MKHPSQIAFIVVLLLLFGTIPRVRGADTPKPVTVMMKFTSTEGKVYSSTVNKVTGEVVQAPVSISESEIWIVRILRPRDGNTMYISATVPGKTDATQASEKLMIFETEVQVESGKPLTVLKTDQCRLDVTLTPE